MTNKPTVIITEHSEFFRAVKAEKIAYYPVTAEGRAAAVANDDDGDPDRVRGFAVYDTTISTSYAVELHATKADAERYQPAPPPAKRSTIFGDPATDTGHIETTTAPAPTKKGFGKLGRR